MGDLLTFPRAKKLAAHRLLSALPAEDSNLTIEVTGKLAAAIRRAAGWAGRDWHDLAAAASRGWLAPTIAYVPKCELREWQRLASACLANNRGTLTVAELDFLRNIAARHTEPSEKQWRWLDAIAMALRVECTA